MKAADVFVKALENEGVERIFGIPGEENLDLVDSISRSNIELVVTRHEQAAGFMAATCGRLTGKPGVCLATLGPGATNLVTAAAYGNLGAMPMVMITGQKPIMSGNQGRFQLVDVVDMMQPLTKLTKQIESPQRIPALVREASRVAQEERPGATHLELPEDVAREPADCPIVPLSYSRRPIAEVKAVGRAVEMISGAQRPLLLLGAGANRKRTCNMLRRFVESTGIFFVTTQMGKGVVDESSPRFVGNAALSSGDFVHRALDAADLIINVGHDVVEKPPFLMNPGGRQVIHLNFTSAEVDPVYFPQLEVIGDIANSIWQINLALSNESSKDGTYFEEIRRALIAHITEDARDDRFPVYPQRLVADVRKAMPSDGIIALDNGIYKIWFARNYFAHSPNTVLLDNALATMGAGLPSAIAAAKLYPQRRVTAICGDGGFMMNSAELETAVRLAVTLVVLILRDDAFGMIKWKQENLGFANFGLDLCNPDFVEYAESFGATGHRIHAAHEIVPTLKSAFEAGGVHVIDVPIDYSDNERDLKFDIANRINAV